MAALEAALRSADADDRRVAASIERLRPDATAVELEQALRRRVPTPSPNEDDPVERQIVALRRRCETTHDLINRRDAIARHAVTTVSDLELLAAQAAHADPVLAADPSVGLDSQLDIDLRALARARQELEQL